MSTSFLALYRGDTVGSAKLVTVSADPNVVAAFVGRLLSEHKLPSDPILVEVERGRRRALRLIAQEGEANNVG
jgi:hypothetical protein